MNAAPLPVQIPGFAYTDMIVQRVGRYCVSTATSAMPELTQLLKAKSMIRYLPANGTAGLARFCERRLNRSPWPPARMTASTLLMAQLFLSLESPTLSYH